MTVTVYNFTCLGIFSVQQIFFVLLKSVLPTQKKKSGTHLLSWDQNIFSFCGRGRGRGRGREGVGGEGLNSFEKKIRLLILKVKF